MASLASPRGISAIGSVEEALGRLPRCEFSTLRNRPGAFRNRDAPKRIRQMLFQPLPAASRTAVLMDGFRRGGGVKIFPGIQRKKLARFKPDTLAGPVSVLRKLAEGAEDRGAWVPRLSHSVLAFNIPLQGFLSDEARELFWRVFQVPVFGQFLGLDGELLAWECEAHNGLHIQTENAIFETQDHEGEPELLVTSLVNLRYPTLRFATGLTATIQLSTCGCGQTVPRLMQLRRIGLKKQAALVSAAASATCAAD
jgi:hypothetical protein